MRRLLEADMKRVVAKVLPWIFLVAACVYVAADLKIGIGSAPDRVFFFLEKIERHNQIVLLIAGFAALIGIYADEFKSMSMITVIGRGISREKFVLAKFLDTCILALQIEILTVVYVMILKAVFGVSLTALETEHLVLVFIMGYIETIASVSVAAIFYFLSENAAIGMFAYIIFDAIIPVTLELVLAMGNVAKYHPERFFISGMAESAITNFLLGDFALGLLYVLAELAVYVCCAVLITVLIFRKKELNF